MFEKDIAGTFRATAGPLEHSLPQVEPPSSTAPLVTVVIPTFNRAHVIGDAIESVLRQTYEKLDPLIVDDGSTDDTLRVLESFGGRVRVISQANAGPSAARNTGINAARGEIVAFLDSDDRWYPTKVERQVNLMLRVGSGFPCGLCNADLLWDTGEKKRSFDVAGLFPQMEEGVWLNPAEILSTRFVFFTQAAAVWTWALRRIGGFDCTYWWLEDWDIALRLALLGPWSFIRDPLVAWVGGDPLSITAKARDNSCAVTAAGLRLIENAFMSVKDNPNHATTAQLLLRTSKQMRRKLRMLEISRKAPHLASLMQIRERLLAAMERRSHRFPRMKERADAA